MIDDELMADLQQRVDRLRDRRWEGVSYELMDDSLFLLITVQVAIAQTERENLDEIGRLLGQVRRELIPPRPDGHACWMIRIEQIYGKSIESYMAVGRGRKIFPQAGEYLQGSATLRNYGTCPASRDRPPFE